MASRQKERLTEVIAQLDHDQTCRILVYVEAMLKADEESKLKEAQLREITGLSSKASIPSDEWEAMINRAKLAEEFENNRK